MWLPFLRESTAISAAARAGGRPRAARRKVTFMPQMQELLAKSYRDFKEGSIVKAPF